MSRSRAGSVSRRLSGWLALQSLAGLAAVCGSVYVVTVLGFQARQDETLAQKEVQVRHLLAEAGGALGTAALRHKLDDFLVGHQDLSLRLEGPDGTMLYERSPNSADAAALRVLRFSMPMSDAGGARVQATMSLDTRDDKRLLHRLGLTLLAAALAGSAVVSAGGFVLVRLGLRPVRHLVDQTRQLAADTLHRRLDGSAQPEELEPLIGQFNALLGRLAQAYEQLEGFNADVAHELCTPLASLIAGTELALRKARTADELREVLGGQLEDLQRMAGIVQDMLFLSQADRGATARREPVGSLAALAAQVADYHEAALAEAGLGLAVVGDAAGDFDVPLLRRALSNLLGNATRYAERGSVVRIEMSSVDLAIDLWVVNQGTDIAPENLPRLFDRFFRADRSRANARRNHGLGLAIVAAIARMHGGRPLARSGGGETAIGLQLWASSSESRGTEYAEGSVGS